MKNVISNINESNWSDCSLISIYINYDEIIITVNDINGNALKFVCTDYIAISYIGQWDENIIHDIKILSTSCFIEAALQTAKRSNSLDSIGGGRKTFSDPWYELSIELIDGIKINIVCARVAICD